MARNNKQVDMSRGAPVRSEAFQLAEIFQMRRVDVVHPTARIVYYECQLCKGRSESVFTEINHEAYCPLNRI